MPRKWTFEFLIEMEIFSSLRNQTILLWEIIKIILNIRDRHSNENQFKRPQMSVEHFVQSETVQYQQIINNEMKSVYQILPRCCKLNCHNVQPEAQSNGHWCACTITLLLFSPFSFSYSSMHLMLCFLAIRLELNVSSAINETTWTKVHFMIVGVQCTWFRDWTPFNFVNTI